jgi:hypothetical protein
MRLSGKGSSGGVVVRASAAIGGAAGGVFGVTRRSVQNRTSTAIQITIAFRRESERGF